MQDFPHRDRRVMPILALFFLHAGATGGIFARIPDLQLALGLNEAELGLMLMAPPVGGLASYIVASLIVERAGPRLIGLVTVPGLALLLVLLGLAPTAVVAALVLLIFGILFSVCNVAMNVEADRIEAASGRRVMNTCHGLWSLGFLVASLASAGARAWPLSPAPHFALALPVILGATLICVRPLVESPPRGTAGGRAGLSIPMPGRAILAIVGFAIIGSAAQGASHNWSVIFLRDNFGAPDWVDAMSIPAFLVTLTVGRLFGDRVTEALGVSRTASAAVLITGFGLLNVVFAAWLWQAMAGFAIIGLGVSVNFPLMISAAARLTDRASAENVASVTMTTGVIMLGVPGLIGLVAENLGLRWAFAMLLPVCVLSLLMVRHVVPKDDDTNDRGAAG